jgi:hypothetical protein
LADVQRLDAFAKRDHPARALDTGNEWGCFVAPQLPRPHANIHEVDAGRADLNERLAQAGSGGETVVESELLRAAVGFYSDCFHGFLFIDMA